MNTTAEQYLNDCTSQAQSICNEQKKCLVAFHDALNYITYKKPFQSGITLGNLGKRHIRFYFAMRHDYRTELGFVSLQIIL